MKILLIQLARLGDIYLTWPAVRAMRKKYPHAEIHYLTRSRFTSALEGLDEIDRIHILPSREIIGPIIHGIGKSGTGESISESSQRVSMFTSRLIAEEYNWVINLSFSPLSSYLTHAISDKKTKVSGYTRSEDGYLSIPDDMSAYFYGQIGPGKANRFHLAEVFATLAECDLDPSDWVKSRKQNLKTWDFAVHIGASENHKNISAQKWSVIISKLLSDFPGSKICLLGSEEEKDKAQNIESSVNVENLVGKTKIPDLFPILEQTKMLLAPDSALIHIAGLTGTAIFNISVGQVNFWETGPRTLGSIIYRCADENEIISDEISEIIQYATGTSAQLSFAAQTKLAVCIQKDEPDSPTYEVARLDESAEFRWQLCQAIYLGKDYPQANAFFIKAAQQLADMNRVILKQIDILIGGAELQKMGELLNRGDEVIAKIAELAPDVGPLVSWLKTEKARIGPGPFQEILKNTKTIHENFGAVLGLYGEAGAHEQDGIRSQAD